MAGRRQPDCHDENDDVNMPKKKDSGSFIIVWNGGWFVMRAFEVTYVLSLRVLVWHETWLCSTAVCYQRAS